jgi:hypothetical protein
LSRQRRGQAWPEHNDPRAAAATRSTPEVRSYPDSSEAGNWVGGFRKRLQSLRELAIRLPSPVVRDGEWPAADLSSPLPGNL